ncbi:glycoside hydrolase domain-containing protein [Brevibacillus porteri]|uniref:glycoside hydrolase domain-containing protein n=1 Tax=Brevibacillus porteri TaxID=2126350 RepID=UPI00370BABC7
MLEKTKKRSPSSHNGIALAIGQIQTKGKISAEEMNQLAERGVPGWDMLAQEIGKSKAELMKMAENGELFAEQALPALMNGLQKRFGGSMKSMSDTFEYTLANIKESGTRKLAVMTSPLFLALKEDLNGIQAFLSSDSAATWGASFSQGLMTAYNATKATLGILSDVASFVSSNWSIIGPIVYGAAGASVAYKIAVAGATLTRAEVEAITAAGMQVVSVFQRGTNDAAGGAVNGTRDGKAALQEAKLIGQPVGTAIYFAVDFDAQPKDYVAIEAYLRAAAKEMPGYTVGVYGSHAVLKEMAKRGACKHFWQTYAWSKGKLSKAANL